MAAVLLIIGAVLVCVGAAALAWQLGVVAFGVLFLLGGYDLTRRDDL